MPLVDALAQMGGVASRRGLVTATSRADLERALAAGDIVRLARGRYALPAASEARRAAHRITAIVSHRSACLEHGWEVKHAPKHPEVLLPKNRRLSPASRRGITVHRADLTEDDIDGIATTKDRTLLDCLRSLPFDEALAIADSALRHGFAPSRLSALALGARGPGATRVRAVARLASGDAANPFESVVRALSIPVPGLGLVPQVSIFEGEFLGRPDLVDTRLRVAVECDSFEWRGSHPALERDARRYTRLAVRGWLVLRFTWSDAMHDPGYVQEMLVAAVAERTDRASGPQAPAGGTASHLL
ncbi:hypothetical protein [Nocardioides sp.]|uniref:hypothetical protein n=1 Tax=Nocardioides sp. TaxID=35761 RepID=UPI0035679458